MITLQIFFCVTIISLAYQIMIRPGELLQRWARFINLTFPGTLLQKLLLCPYCFGGQLSLWCSVYFIINGNSIDVLMSVPCTIVAVYFVVVNNFK